MVLNLCPDALASRCAFSSPSQPSPVDALSACNLATGIPVSAEILSTFAPREATVPNTRMNAAMITFDPFIPYLLLLRVHVSILGWPVVPLMNVKFRTRWQRGTAFRPLNSGVRLASRDLVAP